MTFWTLDHKLGLYKIQHCSFILWLVECVGSGFPFILPFSLPLSLRTFPSWTDNVMLSYHQLPFAANRCADNCHLAQQNQNEFENKGSWNSGCTCGRINDGAHAYTRESKLKLMEHSRIPDAVDENQMCRTANHSECSLNSPSKYNKINGVAAEAPDSGLLEIFEEGGDLEEGPPLVLECGGACLCSVDCGFRITQQGLSVRVTVLRQPQTGWGLHAAQNICKGSFVCEYAGVFGPCTYASQL